MKYSTAKTNWSIDLGFPVLTAHIIQAIQLGTELHLQTQVIVINCN